MANFLDRIKAALGQSPVASTVAPDSPFDIAGVDMTAVQSLPTVRYSYTNATAVVMPRLDETIGDYLLANAAANGKTLRDNALVQVNGEVVERTMTFADIEAKFGAIANATISVPDAQRAHGTQG